LPSGYVPVPIAVADQYYASLLARTHTGSSGLSSRASEPSPDRMQQDTHNFRLSQELLKNLPAKMTHTFPWHARVQFVARLHELVRDIESYGPHFFDSFVSYFHASYFGGIELMRDLLVDRDSLLKQVALSLGLTDFTTDELNHLAYGRAINMLSDPQIRNWAMVELFKYGKIEGIPPAKPLALACSIPKGPPPTFISNLHGSENLSYETIEAALNRNQIRAIALQERDVFESKKRSHSSSSNANRFAKKSKTLFQSQEQSPSGANGNKSTKPNGNGKKQF